MKRILCWLFGHRVPDAYLRDSSIVAFEKASADTGAHSYTVQQPCARCEQHFIVGYVHARGPGVPAVDLT